MLLIRCSFSLKLVLVKCDFCLVNSRFIIVVTLSVARTHRCLSDRINGHDHLNHSSGRVINMRAELTRHAGPSMGGIGLRVSRRLSVLSIIKINVLASSYITPFVT